MAEPRLLAQRLTGAAAAAVGTELVGSILHGSAATGDFAQGFSDIDLLVITDQPLDDTEAERLLQSVGAEARAVGLNVDFRVVTRSSASQPQRSPELEVEISVRIGRRPDAWISTRRSHEPDLVIEYAVCRQDGISVVGPDPAELISEIPLDWQIDVGAAHLRRWLTVPFDSQVADLMVFTGCRTWALSEEKRHFGKVEAARWVLSKRPDLAAVAVALSHRTLRSTNEPTEHAVRTLLATVLEQTENRA